MTSKEKWIETISKIIERTQDHSIKWEAFQTSDYLDEIYPDSYIEACYYAGFMNRNFSLFKREPLKKDDSGSILSSGLNIDKLQIEKIELEIKNADGVSLTKAPQLSILKDLYHVVQEQAADIDSLLEDLINF